MTDKESEVFRFAGDLLLVKFAKQCYTDTKYI